LISSLSFARQTNDHLREILTCCRFWFLLFLRFEENKEEEEQNNKAQEEQQQQEEFNVHTIREVRERKKETETARVNRAFD